MKITVLEVLNAMQPLNQLVNLQLPAPTAYKLGRLANQLNKEVEPIKDALVDMRKSYQVDKEDGELAPDESEKYEEEFNQLMDTTIELDFNPIKIDSLGNIELEAATLMAIPWVFSE